MLNDKGPLMFINTVSTQVDDIPQQKVYDSRFSKKIQPVNNTEPVSPSIEVQGDEKSANTLSFLEERKLNNIIEMYNKNRPVLCNIIYEEKELVGIPFKKDDFRLFVKTDEESVEEIVLSEITDIIIIKF
jgi:hypothetical protein